VGLGARFRRGRASVSASEEERAARPDLLSRPAIRDTSLSSCIENTAQIGER